MVINNNKKKYIVKTQKKIWSSYIEWGKKRGKNNLKGKNEGKSILKAKSKLIKVRLFSPNLIFIINLKK